MRGRSSAKSRLRSAGYKCNLCGRRLIDAATLERHQKNIHNVFHRENKLSLKTKPTVHRNKLSNKEKDKIFDDLIKGDILTESKPKRRNSKNNYENLRNTVIGDLTDGGKIKRNKDISHVKNGESLLVEKDKKSKKKDIKDVQRRVEFECPVCAKTFGVYFTAHKHVQKVHSVNADGKKVPPNSPDLVQPIRVEQCCRCESRIRSNEQHVCPKATTDTMGMAAEFICSGCNQTFVSLKTFDMHVAGLHSDAVDSMFFPTKIEFMNWRLEMERETNGKYSLYGEYESKKIYRCNYARKDIMSDKSTAYFCPSSMVVQDFSKGIQVHFYNKHFDHTANPYTLSSKYKKYSITSFLKNPNDDSAVASAAYSMKLDDKDLYFQFKKLMDSIIFTAVDMDISVLKILIDKALEMSAVITDASVSETVTSSKPVTSMTDKEITEALEMKVLHKRRRSVDSCETTPKPAKRTRNKSLFNQSEIKMSPKIINTFSLASNSNSDEFKSDNGDDYDVDSINANEAKMKTRESDIKSSKHAKINTKPYESFNDSLSFNDSYKDFIDKNFIGKSDTKVTRNTVKTKLGVFKQTSPRKVENKEDTPYDISANNKTIGGIKAINEVNTKSDDAPTSKVNILSVENPNVTITKVSTIRMEALKGTSAQTNVTKLDNPKVNTQDGFSHLVDPLQMNRSEPTLLVEPLRRNVSKVNTRSVSSPLVDPLELNIPKVKTKNIPSIVDPLQRNITKVNTRSVPTSTVDPLKVQSSKMETVLQVDPLTLNTSKTNTPRVYTGPKLSPPILKSTPKVSPKVTFVDKPSPSHNSARITPQKKIKELKYEVREQENDCNILVLKF